MPTINRLFEKPVVNFKPEMDALTPDATIYRVAVSWEEAQEGQTFAQLFQELMGRQEVPHMEALVIGYTDLDDSEMEAAARLLCAHAHRLPELKALFFGDIGSEEAELSWIQNTDLGPVLEAFPSLEYLRTRGGQGLEFKIQGHANLKTLIVETAGLGGQTLAQILAMDLPHLETLCLWLGTQDHGFDGDVEAIKPLITGLAPQAPAPLFPKLRTLGLCNSDIADEIAQTFARSSAFERLDALSMTMGTLGDAGAQALLANPSIRHLDRLDLRSNYIQDVARLRSSFEALGVQVSLQDQKTEDDYGRYVDVDE